MADPSRHAETRDVPGTCPLPEAHWLVILREDLAPLSMKLARAIKRADVHHRLGSGRR